MAQEAILNVSLKDYKKNIDELRGSLLGLEKDSEEYKKIAEELKDRQDKLNEVMSVGKEAVNAADGSYNQLSATLSRLKKEWKNMEMGTPEWEAMAVRINDINNQLKDADASVGVFTRNVGDYANAFEEAFKVSAQNLGSMPGMVGSVGRTINQLIPLIQKANTTATTGLKGVKKAIISTGIGALVVAVGILIANFDKLQNLFRKSDDAAAKLEEDVKSMNEAFATQNEELEIQVKYMEAQGASTEEVNKKKLELIQTQNALTESTIKETKAKLDELKAHSAFRRWITGENKDIEKYEDILKDLTETEKSQVKEIKTLTATIETDKIKEKKKAADEEKKLLDDLLKKVKENSKSEIQALTDKYNEELALLKKYGKDSDELTKQYNADVAKIREKSLDDLYSKLAQYSEYNAFVAMDRDAKKALETINKFASVVNNEFPPEGIEKAKQATAEMLEEARKLGLEGTESAESFALAYEFAYRDYMKTIRESIDLQIRQKDEYIKTQKEIDNAASGTLNLLSSQYKQIGFYADEVNKKIGYLENVIFYIEAFGNLNNVDVSSWLFKLNNELTAYKELWVQISPALAEANRNLDNFVISQGNLEHSFEILKAQFGKDTNWQWFSNTSRFYEIYDARLKAAEWYRDNLEVIEGETIEERKKRELEAEQAILQIKREYAKKHIEISQSLGNGLTSIWGSINDIYEANAKAQGKTDEEIFNQTKGSKIAVATIDTLQGAIAAFMSCQEYPQPYGAILGGIQAAAVTAAGMAQIAQIRATQFNDAGQNISNPQAVVNATPRMSDYAPDLVSNVTGASEIDSLKNALQETPIFVSVTDINAAQIKVTDRNKESSF